MPCFADTNVSQGNVATHARRSGILNMHFNYKFTKESSGEKKLKSVKIRQNYGHESMAILFWATLYNLVESQHCGCVRSGSRV